MHKDNEAQFTSHPAYLDAHCLAFNGWGACPSHKDQVAQQAADRGYWAGLKAREAALRG